MTIYSQGYVSVMLTKEGAARANQLRNNGIEVKATHMRVFRTNVPVQDIPYKFSGEETSQNLLGWRQLPNAETTFDLIENYPTTPMLGFLQLIGTLDATIGTFSYDAVGVYLEDDTLYAIGVTNRLLTKRKAAIGSTSNIQELSFNIAHSTVNELTDFQIVERKIDYTKISEIDLPHLLPKDYNEGERVFRLTSDKMPSYLGGNAFMTTLASHAKMKLLGSNTDAYVWVLSDYIRLFSKLELNFTLYPTNRVQVDVPLSSEYPLEIISQTRTFVLSLADPNKRVKYSALRLKLLTRTTDVTGYHFTFEVLDVPLGLTAQVSLQGILSTRADDGIYQDSILTAFRRMANLQYSPGRRFKSDGLEEPSTVIKPFIGVDTTWAKFDNKIEVSTSQYDGRLVAPSILQPIVNVPGAIQHVRLRASNIWIRRDGNEDLVPTLELDKYVATYGTNATATITATDYPNGSQIAFYVKPPRGDTLTSPVKTYGYATVNNGVASFVIQPNWLKVRNSDVIVVGLVGYPDQETMLSLEIIELESFFSTDLEGTIRITEAGEGDTIYYHARTRYDTPTNATLYISILGSTIDERTDLYSPIPRFFELVNGRYVLPIVTIADHQTEMVEKLILGVSIDSSFSLILTQAELNVEDTSQTPLPTYEMYYSSEESGNTQLYNTLDLGSLIYLIIKATNVPTTYPVTVNFSGTLVLATDTAPNVPNPLEITLINGFASYPIKTVAPTVVEEPEPSGPIIRELRISANQLSTYPLYNKFVETFGTPTLQDSVKLIVNSGVYVVGTNTSMPAIDGTGNWPAGMPITIENSGIIAGKGGDGGTINSGTCTAGTAGGPAIQAQPSNPIIVQNTGVVGGGGGGSGGLWGVILMYSPSPYPQAMGFGGSGGRPNGLAGSKGTPPKSYIWGVSDGSAGSLTAPGRTPSSRPSGIDMNESKGGDLGQAGTAGTGGGLRGSGAGGDAGLRSIGPVTINNYGNGAFYGNAG